MTIELIMKDVGIVLRQCRVEGEEKLDDITKITRLRDQIGIVEGFRARRLAALASINSGTLTFDSVSEAQAEASRLTSEVAFCLDKLRHLKTLVRKYGGSVE